MSTANKMLDIGIIDCYYNTLVKGFSFTDLTLPKPGGEIVKALHIVEELRALPDSCEINII